MDFTEIERKCQEIYSIKQQLETKLVELQRLESEAKEKTKEAQMLEEIAKLRGEAYEGEQEVEELKKTKESIEDYRKRIGNLEQEVFEELKDVALPIPLELPRVSSDGRSTIDFEGGPYNHAIKFIASTLNSEIPLELDKTELHPDKIIVANAKESIQVIERLKALRGNIGRLARIALEERDPDVEEVVEYLHESNYREIWEIIEGRKKITYNDLFSLMSLKTSNKKKRVRNFFTNLEQALKDKFPFIRVSPGVYELAFFGSLVWKRYCDKYNVAKETTGEPHRDVSAETIIKKEEKPEKSTLNKYLSNNEVKEVIYGKEVS